MSALVLPPRRRLLRTGSPSRRSPRARGGMGFVELLVPLVGSLASAGGPVAAELVAQRAEKKEARRARDQAALDRAHEQKIAEQQLALERIQAAERSESRANMLATAAVVGGVALAAVVSLGAAVGAVRAYKRRKKR